MVPQRVFSALMTLARSAGLPPRGSLPSSRSLATVSGSFRALFTSALRRCTTSAGVPAGATRAFQSSAWKPA
ncbi:hypothetical protein D3C87_1348160 [compost metagenome]